MIYSAAMTLLRLTDAETAHGIALRALALGLVPPPRDSDPPSLAVQACGLKFKNPIGLAAGFDKNATAILPLMRLGFGFVEAGTVTKRPQAGNPKPRLFRLNEDRAVINRMGFNNDGIEAFLDRLRVLGARPAPLGANIGINKDGADPERDYPDLVRATAPFADYVTINISSPNTPGLRDLQSEARLGAILRSIMANVPIRPPIFIKLAPDLADSALEPIVAAAIGAEIDGLIIANTTIARPATLKSRNAVQAGGLSGVPLMARSTEMLKQIYRLTRGKLVLIGCGGIRSGADAFAKIAAGASLVQVYTGFAYEGPDLIRRMKQELADELKNRGFASVQDAVGSDAGA